VVPFVRPVSVYGLDEAVAVKTDPPEGVYSTV